jgi:hypothetical protein
MEKRRNHRRSKAEGLVTALLDCPSDLRENVQDVQQQTLC